MNSECSSDKLRSQTPITSSDVRFTTTQNIPTPYVFEPAAPKAPGVRSEVLSQSEVSCDRSSYKTRVTGAAAIVAPIVPETVT